MNRSMRNFVFVCVAFFVVLCLTTIAHAEQGILVVHVMDAQRRPVGALQVGVEGDGGSSITGDDGKARIRLAKSNKEKDWVSLQILNSPSGKDLVMVSPWDYRVEVPSFENESENFVSITVVQRGDRAALENGGVLEALAEKINHTIPNSVNEQARLDPKANLDAVAKQYGLSPEDLDQAIRAWGRTNDPYEAGLAALYERNYPKASAKLTDSLQEREKELASDQNSVAKAAFFLGSSLYEEGKYSESVAVYRRSLQLRPDDVVTLNNLGLSLMETGSYVEAEELLKRSLAQQKKMSEPNQGLIAICLSNLGELSQIKGDYPEAVNSYQQAITIIEKTLGPDHPLLAGTIGNLASVMQAEDRDDVAESLYRRALTIDRNQFGPNHPYVAQDMENLATVLVLRNDYTEAESLLRGALAIMEKEYGAEHPAVATALYNLASLLRSKGDYAKAEPLYHRALEMDEKALGSDHPDVAKDMAGLATLSFEKKDYASADSLLRQALAIDEKAFGPDHPSVATDLYNLAYVLQAEGDYTAAEPLYIQALTIAKKTLGADNQITQLIRSNLNSLKDAEARKGHSN